MSQSKANTPRRRLTANERRESLLDAALIVFARESYAAAPVNAIATAAGVTKPMLYEHFGSKQGLYLALLERESRRLLIAVAASQHDELPLDARFDRLARTMIAFVRRTPDAARILLRTPDGDETTRAAHENLRKQAHTFAVELVLADPAFRPAHGLSRKASASLHAALQGAAVEALSRWAMDHPNIAAGPLARTFVDTLWHGLQHPHPDAPGTTGIRT